VEGCGLALLPGCPPPERAVAGSIATANAAKAAAMNAIDLQAVFFILCVRSAGSGKLDKV
jgi:hypothetical protein